MFEVILKVEFMKDTKTLTFRVPAIDEEDALQRASYSLYDCYGEGVISSDVEDVYKAA